MLLYGFYDHFDLICVVFLSYRSKTIVSRQDERCDIVSAPGTFEGV